MTTISRVAVVPGSPALLPAYASAADPMREWRRTSLDAVRWLGEAGGVGVLAAGPTELEKQRGLTQSAAQRVGDYLISAADVAPATDGPALLVVADGSAARGPKAPGYQDERSHVFDDELTKALNDGDNARLSAIDLDLADELWCRGAETLVALGRLGLQPVESRMWLRGDPFGVQYWVVTWQCAY